MARDSDMVVKVTTGMEMNPFTLKTTNVINKSTGHCADNEVKDKCERKWLADTV